MGAERTVVTSGWRYRRHLRSHLHPVLLVGLLGTAVLAGAAAAALSLPVLAREADPPDVAPAPPQVEAGPSGAEADADAERGADDVADVARGLALVLGVPWMVVGAGALPLLVRALPDLVARRTIEGRAVRVRRPEGRRPAASSPDEWRDAVFLAVDDGALDDWALDGGALDGGAGGDFVAHPLGRARPGRPTGTVFDRVATGDHVRMTVTRNYGHVTGVEVLRDRHGHPVPPGPAAGAPVPTPPGCPVTPAELAATYATTARRAVEEPAPPGVRTWSFDLVEDTDLTVRLHTSTAGAEGLATLLAATAATSSHPWRHTPGTPRFTSHDTPTGPLLVTHDAQVAAALHRRALLSTDTTRLQAEKALLHRIHTRLTARR